MRKIICLLAFLTIVTTPFFTSATATSTTTSTTNSNSPKICLTMIVKNESAIIERCLESAKDHIDCISICDTGSTDNTVSIIQAFMKKNNIPGEVHHHEWKNFGHNRTLSAQAAQSTLKSKNFDLDKTLLLFIDADMVLVAKPEFDKNSLTEDAYHLIQQSPSLSYYNLRLARASLPWECIGVTHEYWSTKDPHTPKEISTLYIDDRDDGGCKSDKFERDIKLLTKGLEDEPDNERYMFYLAQSYRCLRKYDDAFKWYKKRIQKGGWKEEVWFSKFMIGECYEEQNDWEKALEYYLEAYNFNPDRAETLQKIATHYRKEGKNDLAYLFAKHGSKIPYPHHQILFISHPVYDYQFDEEIAISAYYTGFKADGFVSVNKLILNKKAPDYVHDFAYRTSLFYVQNLRGAHYNPIVITLPKIREGFTETFCPMNPSIQKTDDGYRVICRTVNYLQFGGRDHKSCDIYDPTIRTKNFLLHYDKSFNLLSQHEIVDNLPRYRKENSPVEGLEDCRLIKLKNEYWFLCTSYDLRPNGVPQIALCKLANAPQDNKIELTQLTPLNGPDPQRCEKNWLPFIKDGEIHAIYSYDPLVVYKPDPVTGECHQVCKKEQKHNFSAFRGSAAPIEFDDGYLMIVHEVAYTSQRYYLHRFVFMDRDMNITKVSKPFTFLHQGIEYTCGMAIDHSGKNLVIPIGLEDRNAYLCTVDLDNILKSLETLSR